MAHLNREFGKIPGAIGFAFPPPAIPGVGTSGGVTFVLEDRSGKGFDFLAENLQKFMEAARKRPELASVFTTALPSVPQVYVDVDRDQVLQQGVKLQDVYQTMQCFMGGAFVNYFNRFGRQWQVYVQAEGDYRTQAENLGQFYVLNNTNQHGAARGGDQREAQPPARSSRCATIFTRAHRSTPPPNPVSVPRRR